MIKTLMGSIRDYMKVAVATPLIVLGEVICEVLVPFITANLIDAIKDGATVAEMLPTAGFLVLIALTSLALAPLPASPAAMRAAASLRTCVTTCSTRSRRSALPTSMSSRAPRSSRV